MAALTLVLYLVWLLLAFGLRTLVLFRRTGDTGFRGLSGRPGSPEWSAGVLFVAALAAGVAAPMADFGGPAPVAALDQPAISVAGVVIASAGIAATLLAQWAMGDSWRIGVADGEHTELVTSGPFQIVRNPIFTAMAVTSTGLTLMIPNVIALTGLGALLLALQLQVRAVEEPYLKQVHGRAYDHYAASVGRFVPGIGTR